MVNWWESSRRRRRHTHKALEEPNMEDIMETSAGRQLKAAGDVVDDGADPVWPIVAGT
jgi:hypothetical protein